MKIKKTFYNWLTNRFLLIIRNEENFAEKRTISFNYAKLIVLSVTLFSLIFLLCLYLLYSPLFRFLNPEYQEIEKDRKIFLLESKVDSLLMVKGQIDLKNMALDRILKGQTIEPDTSNTVKFSNTENKEQINLDHISSVDIKFRKEMEEENINPVISQNIEVNGNSYYLKPTEGVVENKKNPQNRFIGVDIYTKPRESVKSIAEGVVIFANFSEEGYVIALQHKNGVISIYKSNVALLKQQGEYVRRGDVIALTGNGNFEKKYKLHFEIWQDGNSLNPENFISF